MGQPFFLTPIMSDFGSLLCRRSFDPDVDSGWDITGYSQGIPIGGIILFSTLKDFRSLYDHHLAQ